MKKIFREHAEAMLVSLAALFIVVVAWFLYAAIHMIVPQFNRALGTPAAPQVSGFDLHAASQIDYRGLTGGVSSSAGSVQAPVVTGASFAGQATGTASGTLPASGTIAPVNTTTAN